MAFVAIRCPVLEKEIQTGVQMTEAAFAQAVEMKMRMVCPLCGDEHFWTKKSAWLTDWEAAA
ncbi:hypothetical protein C2U70_19220 [Bradyrhizobium guangdongense]|uniref:hypothetical protein n=1 Tax=Bradyrhizobium guangdongense TaxID=1325090 RepID=UPI00112A0961|nr:hypothetical protein [Bradyrhizobium guangdongense]TPQ33442.1 hypothetical protein C2U70_19220 [Bradyrhizobium guangdongense]